MESKIGAAELAAGAGIPTVIAGGEGEGVLPGILAGRSTGTRFAAAESAPAFKLWLRHGKRMAARITVDDGAPRAIIEGNASLLAVGVTGWDSEFRVGDGVEIVGPPATRLRGASRPSTRASSSSGRRASRSIHRDRLVLL